MRAWIVENIRESSESSGIWSQLSLYEKKDFEQFEGNAQTFRLITQLQNVSDKRGLNLTYATLATLLKYPCGAQKQDKNVSFLKKVGVFCSEREIANEVWAETGLEEGQRHPLAWIVEACDDIAYSVMDVEDSVKKGLVSFADVIAWIEKECSTDIVSEWVVDRSKADHLKLRKKDLTPAAVSDLTIQKFRVFAISAMVSTVRKAFIENFDAIESLTFRQDLVSASTSGLLCRALKKFAYERAYKSPGVLKIELEGARTIHRLMTLIWGSIQNREELYQTYIYSRISENYRSLLEESDSAARRIHLLCDMVAGMTDTFACSLEAELHSLNPEFRCND